MTIQQLYYLVAIADEGLISKAAYKLKISQSGLSQAIARIEQQLGLTIFTRTHTGIVVTTSGEAVIDQARQVLRSYHDLNFKIEQLKTQQRDVFRLAVSDEISRPFVDALLEVQDQYPEFKVQLVQTNPTLAVRGVRKLQYDAAFLTYCPASRSLLGGLDVHDCLSGVPQFYTMQQHYLQEAGQPVSIEVLLEQEFVLYDDDQLMADLDRFQKKYGRLNISLVTDNLQVIYEFLQKFRAVTFLRDFQLRNSLYQDKRAEFLPLPVADLKFGSSRYAWVTQPENQLSPIEEQLMQGIVAHFHDN